MRKIALALILSLPIMAGIYKAKIEPYEKTTISSEVSGKIIKLDQKDELKLLNKKVLIIDHDLESKELANSKMKLRFLEDEIKIKKDQFERIKNLKGKSIFAKERYKSELLNLQIQKRDLLNAIAKLQDIINKKEISLKNRYLKKLYVKEGTFVMPGMKLMDIEDTSASRIILYLDAKDKENIKNKKILIDGREDHGYKIQKVALTTDEKYISSYRVELVKQKPALFGKIVTVEIGDKK